jgi:hypothetical protein
MMVKISRTDCWRNEEVLRRVKVERNILNTIKRKKANWIGHIWRRKCLLKQSTEGRKGRRIEVTGRRERRRKQLLDRSWIGRILCRNCLLKQVIEKRSDWKKRNKT